MIKRVIGIVASLAIVALIVFTVLGAGSYKSMLPESLFSSSEAVEEAAEGVADEVAAEVAGDVQDSVEESVESADSTALDSQVAESAAEEMTDDAEAVSESDEQGVGVE